MKSLNESKFEYVASLITEAKSKEEILDKLVKLKALADRGVGGEKTNAQAFLDATMKKHGYTLDDVKKHKAKLDGNSYSGGGYGGGGGPEFDFTMSAKSKKVATIAGIVIGVGAIAAYIYKKQKEKKLGSDSAIDSLSTNIIKKTKSSIKSLSATVIMDSVKSEYLKAIENSGNSSLLNKFRKDVDEQLGQLEIKKDKLSKVEAFEFHLFVSSFLKNIAVASNK